MVHGALLAVFDLAARPRITVLLLVAAFVAWGWAARRLESTRSEALVLGVAIILRLLLLPLPPTLSDDTLRYVWDGRVTAAGFNPYLHPPESETLAPLRDPLWDRMPHKHVPTVYPPLALGIFTVAGQLPTPLVTVKVLLTAVELLGCWLLLRLVAHLGLPAGRALWYCWNPLATMEIAGMGHVDALLVTAGIATVYALVRGRPGMAGLAAAAGVLGKLLPLVALPMWARQSGRPWVFLATVGAVLLVTLGPVFVSVQGVPPGLVTYGVSWEFNGALYEPLWRGIDHLDLVPTIKRGLDRLKDLTGLHEALNPVYHYVYPQFLAKLLLAGLFGLVALRSLFDTDPILGSGRLFAGLMLTVATLYPWYLLILLPWAALCRHRAWLTLSALLQLAYVPQLLGIDHWPWIYAMLWIPFFVLWIPSRWSID